MRALTAISSGFHSTAGKKDGNHDSAGIVVPDDTLFADKGVVAAVADGLSSSPAAREASEACVRAMLQDYLDTPASWTVQSAVTWVLSATNRWMYGHGRARFDADDGMASTLSTCVIKGRTAHIFQLGDSRISLLRGGRLEVLTTEHRENRGVNRGSLFRAMGTSLDLQADYRHVEVSEGDILVMSTDGVHDSLDDGEIATLVTRAGPDLDKAAEAMCAAASSAGSGDNLTCLLLTLGPASEAQADARLPFPPDLEPGHVLDDYKVIREMHASSRSQVYLVEDTRTGEVGALKAPSRNHEDNSLFIQQFEREGWIASQVASPHVVQPLPERRHPSFLYSVLEHVEGQTLKAWMKDNPGPGLAQVRDIASQIVMGLRALHRKGIIHQDLKPDNIMIRPSGTCVLIDFGSARIEGVDDGATAAVADHGLGTVEYSAPEMLTGRETSPASDLYSLATIVYEMLTGEKPYARPLTSERRIDKASYRHASDIRDDVPWWMDRALERALAISPTRRQPALSSFLEDIHNPNPAYGEQSRPLIERNPVAFWQSISFILAILLLLSLAW